VRVETLARLVTAVLAATVIAAACGSGGTSGDPTATVKDFVSLVEQKQFDKIPDIACAAQKDAMKEQFDIAGQLAGSLEGVDAKSITDAMTIKFDNLEVKEVEKSADKAKVSLKGTLKLSVDKAKMTDLLKKVLVTQGLPVDDATVATMLDSMVGAFEQGEPVDSSVDLVVENGKWLVCGVTQ
jgi:hypothetical protein